MAKRSHIVRVASPIVFLLGLTSACGDDDGGGVLSTTGLGGLDETTMGVGVDETAGAEEGDPTGADSTGGGEGGEPDPCAVDPDVLAGGFDVAFEEAAAVDVSAACNSPYLVSASNPEVLDPDNDNYNVYVYRPALAGGAWPPGPRPALFFSPGNGQNIVANASTPTERYAEIMRALAAQGVVVFAAQPTWPGVGGQNNWSSAKRTAMLACTMVWAKNTGPGGWAEASNSRISNAALLSGHSRGGAANNILISGFETFQNEVLEMQDYELCGALPIAPRWGDATAADPTNTQIVVDRADAPPYLVIQGALDEDTRRGGPSSYDSMVREPEVDTDAVAAGVQPPPIRVHDKSLVWLHGVMHNSFGGTLGPWLGDSRARAAASYYLPEFLRWQLTSSAAARAAFMKPMSPTPEALEFPPWPPSVADETLWNTLPGYDTLERPLVFVDYVQRSADANERYVVDAWGRFDASGQPLPYTCASAIGSLGVSNAGFPVRRADGFTDAQTCHGSTAEILAGAPASQNAHQTRALYVQWGAELGTGGVVEWELNDPEDVAELDLSQFSHLSLRVANLADYSDEATCVAEDVDDFQLEVTLVTEDGTPSIVTEPIIDTPGDLVLDVNGNEVCAVNQAMTTVRIPLSAFCSQGSVSLSAVQAVRVGFPDDIDVPHRALIDSLEFTRDDLDPATSFCGSAKAGWNCEATGSLTAVEHSCATEPTTALTCPTAAKRTTAVPLPVVAADANHPSSFSGWVVHTPAGWIDDVQSPSVAEIDTITGLCRQACQLEWSDDPQISATCSASAAFATPTLRRTPDVGVVHRIPESRRSGAGIFPAQALSCDLEGSCCDVFDELVCAAKPTRTTSAGRPLQRAEEHRMQLGGTATSVTFTTPGGSSTLPLVGEMGYSFCPQGDSNVNCPFYLGSLELASTGSVAVTDACPGGGMLDLDVSELSIELLQPAMGIADDGSVNKAMPEGSLHLLLGVTVGGQRFAVRAVNEHDVFFLSARRTGVDAEGVLVQFDVPCGAGTLPVTASFDLASTTVLETRPTVSIGIPNTRPCPGTVTLNATASDPDGDLLPVRWEVDGVRIAPGTTSLPFTRAHTFRSIARDARGATTIATKIVSCQ